MNRITVSVLAVYQTTWIRDICGIIFDNLTVLSRVKDFIQKQIIFFGFFASVLSNVDAIGLDSVDNVGDVHSDNPLTTL